MSFEAAERGRPVEPGVVLHPSFADSALAYFRKHDVAWWGGEGKPTRSPISSQVACVNHLDPARMDEEVALAVAREIALEAERAVAVEDDGFVIEEARKHGVLRLTLLTDSHNRRAQALYAKSGFRPSGMLPMRLHFKGEEK